MISTMSIFIDFNINLYTLLIFKLHLYYDKLLLIIQTLKGVGYMEDKVIKQEWYKTNVVIILSLVFFFPIGIFLMWKYSKWENFLKICVCISIVLFLGLSGIVGATNNRSNNATNQEQIFNEYREYMINNSNGIVLDVEMYNESVFNMTVSNAWYLSTKEEKQYFCEEVFKNMKQLMYTDSNNGTISLIIYDESSTKVAKSKLSGGMEILK